MTEEILDKDILFSRDLLKGKIAEVVFEQMFRDSEKFIVLPFGYEKTVPEVAQYQDIVEVKRVLDNIRHAPDFIVITSNRKQVYLVEVKYRSSRISQETKAIAEEIRKHWDIAFLFLATPEGFFFDSINKIISQEGEITELLGSWIDTRIQARYLSLLTEFERNN